jgi:hypothetical protein
MSSSQNYETASDWKSGPSDTSPNRAEIAAIKNHPNLIGVRSTFNASDMTVFPRDQLRALARDIETGELSLPTS